MKVRTIRKHGNEHGPRWTKEVGRKYELDDRTAKRLIAAKLVEEDKAAPKTAKADEGSD